MYLGYLDYGVLAMLLCKPNYRQLFSTPIIVYLTFLGLSAGIGIYQGCIGSKQLSAREFLVADGRMAVMQL
jgi:hypothetical protein